MSATVVNKRAHRPARDDIYIGRPGPWGNPFRVAHEADRHDAVCKYSRWLIDQIRSRRIQREALEGLHDRTLVCWCAPLECHGAAAGGRGRVGRRG